MIPGLPVAFLVPESSPGHVSIAVVFMYQACVTWTGAWPPLHA